MYNNLREKVNLLLEDQTSEKPEEKDVEKCPECGKPVDNCEFQTAQESLIKPKNLFSNGNLKNEFDGFGTDEHYVSIAKQILKKQKKLGKLKSVKVQVIPLDESRKKRLKSAGILMGTTIGLSALAAAFDYTIAKKANDSINAINRTRASLNGNNKAAGKIKTNRKSLMKDSAKRFGVATGAMAGLGGASLVMSVDNRELVIICDYKYGKKILPLFELTEKVDTKKASSTIESNVTKAVKKLQNAQEWAVKEDFSQLDFSKKYMTELLIESMEE